MTTEILNLGAVAIIFLFFLKEFFAYLKVKKIGNGHTDHEAALTDINNKLGNHLTEVNGKIGDIEREMTAQSMDIKIIKNCLNDIKIKIK